MVALVDKLAARCRGIVGYYGRRAKFVLGVRRRRDGVEVLLRGKCNICGLDSEFSAPNTQNLRESLHCAQCGSTARNRMLASGLLTISLARSFASVAAWARSSQPMKILDTDCYSPIYQTLRRASFYQASVYMPEKPFGVNIFERVMNIDLQSMPFDDETFDVILTSDVMEHVRCDEPAYGEIYRCLKPSGYYIFTVPYVPSWPATQIRVDSSGTNDVHLMPKEYHGDPVTGHGVLVYRIYGSDLIDRLTKLGFDVVFDDQPDVSMGMPTKDLFICRKLP